MLADRPNWGENIGDQVGIQEQISLFMSLEGGSGFIAGFPKGDNVGLKELQTWFDLTERRRELVEIASEFYRTKHLDSSGKEFEEHFAGAVFEHMAYAYMRNKLGKNDSLLLSPESTFQIYRAFYPQRIVTQNPVGIRVMRGVSVPDGLLVDDTGKIIKVFEYSLKNDTTKFPDREGSYWRHSTEFPRSFDLMGVVFVTPLGKFSETNDSFGFEIEHLPFYRRVFRKYADSLLKIAGKT